MLHFIPAWYQENTWFENEQNWYVRRKRTEFDDTVKQIQLFHRSKAYPFEIMLLSFAPNLRHFLHRQSVYHAPYWSCFDAMQEIRRKKAMVLSYHNLNWPAHTEFVFTPFAIVAFLRGHKYAQIEFGEDGNLILVDMYQGDVIQRRNIYDDRGFISSTVLYEEGKRIYQDYLTEKGIWKLRHFFDDGHVEINPRTATYLMLDKEQTYKYSRLSYDSMEQVILEVLSTYLELLDKTDMFCVSMHKQHMSVLKQALHDKKKILSFFESRYLVEQHPEDLTIIEKANFIITDSQDNTKRICNGVGKKLERIKDITPFDSRVDFGISQQLNVQKILVPIDGLDDLRFGELIQHLGEYLYENENAQIHLFTRLSDYNRKKILLEKTRQCLKKSGFEEGWALEDNDEFISENEFAEEDNVPVRFFVEQCVDEFSVNKCIREQRIIVDMRDITEVYLRITAISVGIPQLVYTRTQFVEHGKNGFIINKMENICEALRYYLDGLANWNESMVFSYELGKKYTTKVLIDEWKEVIEIVGSD